MFEEFKNLYSLTKTITFNLNPTEITKKNMEENNHMLLRDLELNNKEYLIHDAFDKIFTSNNNNVSNDLFVDRLNILSYSYRCFKNNNDLKKEYEKSKNEIIKFIADQFRNEDGNKLLFSKDTIKVIKDSDILIYGEININDPHDVEIIKHFNIKNEEINSNFVHSNFDFENGCFTTKEGFAKTYPTSDALLWFKYNYVLLGKPKRIIVYRTTKTITK